MNDVGIKVSMARYEELVRKEEQLNILLRIIRNDVEIAANTLMAIIARYEDDGK